MATEIKIKELSMNNLVLGENKQIQKVSLKSETMREKLCSIFTEIALKYMHAQLFSVAGGVNLGLIIHLRPFFVGASIED